MELLETTFNTTSTYYTMQVRTRWEEKYISRFKAQYPDITLPLHFPKRILSLRKAGKNKNTAMPIFPGYLFLEIPEDERISDYFQAFRKTDGFFRFLKANNDIVPLQKRDLEIVLHFVKKVKNIAGISKVCFDENSKIVVLSGPLSGLEGKIVVVDTRKKRAKIKLDLYDNSFCIDLAFEVIEKVNR